MGQEGQRIRDEAQSNLRRFEAESEKAQLFFMLVVLVTTISAGTILMIISLVLPIFIAAYPNAPPALLQQINEAPKNVLPFATGLLGFAGGLVTAIYGEHLC